MKKGFLGHTFNHGCLHTGQMSLHSFFLTSDQHEAGWKLGTQIIHWGWIFWTIIFLNLKRFTSRSI
jgi:hypothetical protein